MDLSKSTITMPTAKANEALREYRDAVRTQTRKGAKDELALIDDAVIRGYRELARGNRLVQLSVAVAAAGVQEVLYRKRDGEATALVPRLAVTRADARHCFCGGVREDGAVTFYADDPNARRRADKIAFPAGTFPDDQRCFMASWSRARAIVPQVPAPLRPKSHLRNYHLLWEADWGAVPVDPALLKHLGGDLYVLLAVWDLSPLERAVLAGHRA